VESGDLRVFFSHLAQAPKEYSKLTDIHMLAQGAEASLSFEKGFPNRRGQILAKVPKCAFVSTAKFYLFG